MSSNEQKRLVNFELLRIVAMFGIVILHYQLASGILRECKFDNPNYYVSRIMETLCIGGGKFVCVA